MTAKVITFTGITKLDLPPERILRNALEADDLEGLVILGYDKAGEEVFISSYADGGTVMWLLERCKTRLMAVGEEA